jgi:dTDP-4-amino-4,6-dideoxygalactose transaminase
MIFTNLAPNTSFRDLRILSSFFLLPTKWKQWQEGEAKHRVQYWLQEYLGTDHIYLVDSGRSALYIGLQALGIGKGDEVIVPGYTCIVVTNAIRAVGAVPVLVDITDELNVNIELISEAITPQTKAILAQHTFGLPTDIVALQHICTEKNLFLIEDCAHALGAHVIESPVGTFGDISFFSFGSDKIVSSVRGGALAVHNTKAIAEKASALVASLRAMQKEQLRQHVLYISAFTKLKVWYQYGGKAILFALRKFGITASIIDPSEKEGTMATWGPTQYPNILAAIVLPQLHALYAMKMKRRIIAMYYKKHLPVAILFPEYHTDTERTYLHFPILIEDVSAYKVFMKRHGVQVGTDWNGTPIAPSTATQIDVVVADISHAVELSKKIVQLPIHQGMTIRKAKKVVKHTCDFLSVAKDIEKQSS